MTTSVHKQTLMSRSAAESVRLGERIGKKLKAGDVVVLSGGLGAGKTTLIQGIVRGLGSTDPVSSPTFTLIHEYEGRVKIYHLDWYRLKKVTGPDRQMALECLADTEGVVLTEWPERGKALLPKSCIRIRLQSLSPEERKIYVEGVTL